MTFKPASILWFLLAAPFGAAAISPFYQLKLTPITANAPSDLSAYRGQVLIVMLVQPDCSWCKKQHKLLTRLAEQQPNPCQDLAVMMMATGGGRHTLKRAMNRYQSHFPITTLPNKLAQSLTVKSAPQLFILDSEGALVTYHIGFMPEHALRSALNGLMTKAHCEA
ncbi:TlpA family protein disulfide reductase [Pseudoalteromonas luteoviolacea]|uniref:Thioredoxin domain-containing protein n=1 Tax=Pseudoalteromonas luteoviolacea S4054 TaxID=1129367 RepID=A0A0F6AIB6_9GAMM|nr:TlpA disulfide reductase family protein [Pseudoalteromonas luteoviolacea]AOT06420.1 hypothetical protein S4054249_00275 [Pseudoalteromonas luteoviolacea]AOT11337.1 hypothetical protein S40542_00275 [Pseudoalteromonas luteoviolacea]AOT16250.1 hypothetical protein S4054_00275 [Pseudoalteromonas luteoviolacea]KKE85576.1 hypothetical protein N479_04560 [Pseudoalteromonas luteoviolacea S4054]KZN73018.1 hypothetical protein N481_13270 [Pseudoalteromonas luteoviolacea S4047-1]